MRQIMASFFVCVVVCIGSGSTVRATEPELSPLLTKDVVGLVHWRGEDTWEAYKQTASYRAFYETGLVPALNQQIHRIPWQQYLALLQVDVGTQLQSAEFETILKTLWQNGATCAIGLQEREVPAPYVLLIARGCGEKFTALQQFVKSQGGMDSLEVDVAGRKLMRYADAVSEVACWKEGADLAFFMTWGDGTRRAEVDRLLTAATEAHLVQQPQWTESWSGDPVPTDNFRVWVNIAQVGQAISKFPEVAAGAEVLDPYRKIISWAGIDQLKSIAYRSGYHGDHLISQWSVTSDKAPMQWAGWGDQTVTLGDLPPLPADVTSFSLQVVDASRIYRGSCELAEEIQKQPEQIIQFLSGMGLPGATVSTSQPDNATRDQIQLGMDALGTAVCIYQDRQQQVLPWGFPTVAIQVKNKDALVAQLDALPKDQWKRDDRWGCPAYYHFAPTPIASASNEGHPDVNLSASLGSATLAVCDGWLVCGIQPQTVQTFVLRSQGKLKRWNPELIPATTREKLPERFSRLTFSDPRASVSFLGSLAPWAANGLQSIADLMNATSQLQITGAVDSKTGEPNVVPAIASAPSSSPLDIPPVEVMNAQLFPNVSVTVLDGTTIRDRTYGSTFIDRPVFWGISGYVLLTIGLNVEDFVELKVAD